MPDASKMMFVRPKNCRYCGHGYYGLLHAVQYAQSKGLWNIIDISAEQANKGPIYEAIDQHDPASFYGFGHGSSCTYTGDSEEPIFTCNECDRLNGRVVYLLSCLTGIGLGQAIINAGALAYAGFTVSWTWLSDSGTDGDPYADKYARGFWESANELWNALVDGEEFHDAVQRSIDKYDEWIDYWYYDNPQEPYSQECIKWLAVDRDGLIALDICDAITDETQCQQEGCYWYEDHCHSAPPTPPPGGGGLALAMVPIIAIVGIAYIVGQKKQPVKKKR